MCWWVVGSFSSGFCKTGRSLVATEEMLQSLENHSPCPEHRSLTPAHVWGVHRWRIGPGWMHYSIVPVPAAADAGWVWRLYLLRCKVFSSSFSFSYFSKGKHLWMSLPEAITSTWRTWLSKPIDFTNGRRWAAYTTAPVLSPLHWDSTYQLSEEKKYRTSRDSLTSIFIPLLKKNRSPHHANSIYLRHSLFKKASVVRNPRLHWWGMGISKSYLTAAPKGIELIPFPRRRNWRTEWENA